MRNLQKILALVMAMVMSFSLLATVNAADFPDAGEISETYSDAVTVLNGLKVFQGYKEDGTFRPKGNITRAEVAAIIYRIVTGDVDDTQKDIYSSWGKFNDVLDGSWYAGYVNYCANAGYIKGYNNTTFGPNDQVTGYQALAMILRAVGYDKNGEFTGSQWQIRTASIARERGVTKNVTDTLLGQAATRETVAELLFRSIIIPKVDFNANTLSYTVRGDKETLGYESLKLEEITGIVTANEYADLESSKALNSGKTRMVVEVDNKATNYTLDYSEENLLDGLDAIGEEHNAYIQNANTTSAKVLVMAKTDKNKTYETLEKKDIDSSSDFRSVTGFQRGSATKDFVNFDQASEWKSDNRIRWEATEYFYVRKTSGSTTVSAQDALDLVWKESSSDYRQTVKPLVTDVTSDTVSGVAVWSVGIKYGHTIAPKDVIGSVDQYWMKRIFYTADRIFDVATGYDNYVTGEVYVNTTSLKDISDTLSWDEFIDQYIKTDDTTVKANQNGNWLKVIDNDNDGEADYVLKIVYTMAQVVRAKDSKYGLDVEDKTLCNKNGESVNYLKEDNVKSEDTLVLDDIVYYAVIDETPWATKAEQVTAKIDVVNRKDLKVTTTDGTEYTESGVCGNEVVSNDYSCGVVNMNGSATYDMYLDRGGFLALFNDSHNDFTLIVDGWYNETKSGTEYAVRAYNDETGRQDVVDVNRGGDLFIDGHVAWDRYYDVQNNDWHALKWLGGTTEARGALDNINNIARVYDTAGKLNGDGNGTPTGVGQTDNHVKTTVAVLSGDVIQPVDYSTVGDKKEVRMLATANNAIPLASGSYNAKVYRTSTTDTAYNELVTDNAELRALSSTVYYLVYRANSESGYAVERYVGYSNVPKVASTYVEDVYAVGTRQERTSSLGSSAYYTANVVVVELNDSYKGNQEQVFIYDMPVVSSSVTIEEVGLIHEDGKAETGVKIDFGKSRIRDYQVAMNVATSSGWRNWGPGLYYMYPTNTEGVYTVQPMYADDIAATDYVVGWSATSLGTVPSDYISVLAFNGNGTTSGYSTDLNIAYDLIEKAANRTDCTIYTLGYTDRGVAELDTFAADAGAIQRYMAERTDVNGGSDYAPYDHNDWAYASSLNRENWNQNRVLVHYKDGNAKYAISFSNKSNRLARDVWTASLPMSVDSKWGYNQKKVDFAEALTRLDDALNATSIAWRNNSYYETIQRAAREMNGVDAMLFTELNDRLPAGMKLTWEDAFTTTAAEAVNMAWAAINDSAANSSNTTLEALAAALNALDKAGVTGDTYTELENKIVAAAVEDAEEMVANKTADEATQNALESILGNVKDSDNEQAVKDTQDKVDAVVEENANTLKVSVTAAELKVTPDSVKKDETLGAVFTLSAKDPANYEVGEITAVKAGSETLVKDTDYSVTGNTIKLLVNVEGDIVIDATASQVILPAGPTAEAGTALDLTGHKAGETVTVTVTNETGKADVEDEEWYEVRGGGYGENNSNYAAAKMNDDKSTTFDFTLTADDQQVTFTLRPMYIFSGGNGSTLRGFDENNFIETYKILRANTGAAPASVGKMARSAEDPDAPDAGERGAVEEYAYELEDGKEGTTFNFVWDLNPKTNKIGLKFGAAASKIKDLVAEMKKAKTDADGLPQMSKDGEETKAIKGIDGGEKANGDDATRVEGTGNKVDKIVLGLGQPKAIGAKLPTELTIDGKITVKITWYHGTDEVTAEADGNIYAKFDSGYTYKVRISNVDDKVELAATVEVAKADEETGVEPETGKTVESAALEAGTVEISEEGEPTVVTLYKVTVSGDATADAVSVAEGETAKIVLKPATNFDPTKQDLSAMVGTEKVNVVYDETAKTYTVVVTVDKADVEVVVTAVDKVVEPEKVTVTATVGTDYTDKLAVDESSVLVVDKGGDAKIVVNVTGTLASDEKVYALIGEGTNDKTVLTARDQNTWVLDMKAVAANTTVTIIISNDEVNPPERTVSVTVDGGEAIPATKGEDGKYTAKLNLAEGVELEETAGTTTDKATWTVDVEKGEITIDVKDVAETILAVKVELKTKVKTGPWTVTLKVDRTMIADYDWGKQTVETSGGSVTFNVTAMSEYYEVKATSSDEKKATVVNQKQSDTDKTAWSFEVSNVAGDVEIEVTAVAGVANVKIDEKKSGLVTVDPSTLPMGEVSATNKVTITLGVAEGATYKAPADGDGEKPEFDVKIGSKTLKYREEWLYTRATDGLTGTITLQNAVKINDDIVIDAEADATLAKVTVTDTNLSVTPEQVVVGGTVSSFKLTPKEGYVRPTDANSVTVEMKNEAGVSGPIYGDYDPATGEITLHNERKVTGDITINATASVKIGEVEFTVSNDKISVTGVSDLADYRYAEVSKEVAETIKEWIGDNETKSITDIENLAGEGVLKAITSSTTLDNSNGTVPWVVVVKLAENKLSVVAVGVRPSTSKQKLNITLEGSGLKIKGATGLGTTIQVEKGSSTKKTVVLTAEGQQVPPSSITKITMGGKTLVKDVDYKYDGKGTIDFLDTGDYPTFEAAVTITASASTKVQPLYVAINDLGILTQLSDTAQAEGSEDVADVKTDYRFIRTNVNLIDETAGWTQDLKTTDLMSASKGGVLSGGVTSFDTYDNTFDHDIIKPVAGQTDYKYLLVVMIDPATNEIQKAKCIEIGTKTSTHTPSVTSVNFYGITIAGSLLGEPAGSPSKINYTIPVTQLAAASGTTIVATPSTGDEVSYQSSGLGSDGAGAGQTPAPLATGDMSTLKNTMTTGNTGGIVYIKVTSGTDDTESLYYGIRVMTQRKVTVTGVSSLIEADTGTELANNVLSAKSGESITFKPAANKNVIVTVTKGTIDHTKVTYDSATPLFTIDSSATDVTEIKVTEGDVTGVDVSGDATVKANQLEYYTARVWSKYLEKADGTRVENPDRYDDTNPTNAKFSGLYKKNSYKVEPDSKLIMTGTNEYTKVINVRAEEIVPHWSDEATPRKSWWTGVCVDFGTAYSDASTVKGYYVENDQDDWLGTGVQESMSYEKDGLRHNKEGGQKLLAMYANGLSNPKNVKYTATFGTDTVIFIANYTTTQSKDTTIPNPYNVTLTVTPPVVPDPDENAEPVVTMENEPDEENVGFDGGETDVPQD